MRPSIAKNILSRLTRFADALDEGEDISAKFTCRKVVLKLEPTRYSPRLVKQTRALMNASQAIFAKFLGVSVDTVQSWESGAKQPSDMAGRFMDEIRAQPAYWQMRLAQVMSPKSKT